MKIYKAEPVVKTEARHGESSWWSPENKLVWFMDCMGARAFSLEPKSGEIKEYPLPFNPMAAIGCKSGGYIAASEDTIYLLNEDFQVKRELMKVKHTKASNRFNDCKCGPDGSFYLGSMGTQGEPDEGKLLRFSADGRLEVLLDKVGISNGFAWSKDEKTFFYTDTIHGEIYAFDYVNGIPGNKRVIFRDEALSPDGFCIDAQDNLWVALWGAYKVVCVDTKTGEILAQVQVDAPLTSSAVFGGEELDTLYITTSRLGLTEEELEKAPLSGSLFAAKVDVKGRELYRGDFV